MASRRLWELKALKSQDKPRSILNKKPDFITGWHSANTHEANDFVAWVAGKANGDNQRNPSSTAESLDTYRHGFGWCSSLEDKELFRRHSLHEHYVRPSGVEQTKGDNTSFCKWPALKDDSQRKSLDILVKSITSQLPGAMSRSPSTLKSTQTDKSSRQESQANKVKIPKDSNACNTNSQDSENFSNKSTSLPPPWLGNTVNNDHGSSGNCRPQTNRQFGGDARLANDTDIPGGPSFKSDLTLVKNYRAKLVYSKKDTKMYESTDEDRRADSKNDFHRESKEKSTFTEVCLQKISQGSLGPEHLSPANKRSRKNTTNLESQNLANQQHEANLTSWNSLEQKDRRPRLLVLRKISIQDSSETGDDLISRTSEGADNANRLSFSFLTPLKIPKHKRDSNRAATNVLVYQNDLLKSDKLSIPWIKTPTPKVNINSKNSLQSIEPLYLPSSQLMHTKGLRDLDNLQKNSKTHKSSINNEPLGSGNLKAFNNSSIPNLQYLGQPIHQNDNSPRRLSTHKLSEGSATEVALATASCEDLCSLSLLNLFHADMARCMSVPVEPQLTIPRVQGFRPYNSMSPLQRAKNIAFRRLHGFVAHLPDGSETFKITAPNIPATRIDRLETAKKLNRLDSSFG